MELAIRSRAEVAMKKMKDKLTAMLNAMTFAEAGEHEAAVEYLDQVADNHSAVSHSRKQPEQTPGTVGADLIQRVEDHMAAAAFAEAGEFDSALEMLHQARHPRSVLLVLDGRQAESEAFTYAVNLCKRISAGIELLAFPTNTEKEMSTEGSSGKLDLPQGAHERLEVLWRIAEQHGVSCGLSVEPGNAGEDLFDYVLRHKEIAAVILGSLGKLQISGDKFSLQQALERIAERLSIPLVTVLKKRQVT